MINKEKFIKACTGELIYKCQNSLYNTILKKESKPIALSTTVVFLLEFIQEKNNFDKCVELIIIISPFIRSLKKYKRLKVSEFNIKEELNPDAEYIDLICSFYGKQYE